MRLSPTIMFALFAGMESFAPALTSTRFAHTASPLVSRKNELRTSSLTKRTKVNTDKCTSTRILSNQGVYHSDDDWNPKDTAKTTPQLLRAIWDMICQGSTMVKGETMTVEFPEMQDQFSPTYLNVLMGHLDSCKDVCDSFGIMTSIVPYTKGRIVTGFTIKSFRNPDKNPDSYEFDYDPMWDDGDDWSHEGVDDEYDDEIQGEFAKFNLPEIENPVPDDDDEIINVSKTWVDKMMSDMGLCPFTSGPDMSGMPLGKVFYCVDRGTKMEDLYQVFWKEVVRVESNNEKDLSTTLLIAPEFCMENIEMFENFSNTLTQTLDALGVEDLLQLIFFHPNWIFRDGGERSGDGAAANYARRSPWPMINILRTPQVRKAQRGIPTGLVYQQNEKTLGKVGTESLEMMLRLRNWDAIADVKINRRDMEALRIAQDYQSTGEVKAEDQTVIHDSTPAANKIDDEQAGESNLVNVLKTALEKRLGIESDGLVAALNGPETSATVMASDFLLKTLNAIAKGKTTAASISVPVPIVATKVVMQHEHKEEAREEEELGVLFGGAGIMEKNEEDIGGDSIRRNSRNFY